MAKQNKPKVAPTTAPKTVSVPLELVEQTLNVLLQMPVGQGYLLVQKWEAIHPAFFRPADA